MQERWRAGEIAGEEAEAQQLVEDRVDGAMRPGFAAWHAQAGADQTLLKDGFGGRKKDQAFQPKQLFGTWWEADKFLPEVGGGRGADIVFHCM